MIDIKLIIGFIAGVVVSHIYPVVATTFFSYVTKGLVFLQAAMALSGLKHLF